MQDKETTKLEKCNICREKLGRHLFDEAKESAIGPVHSCIECAEWVRVSLRNSKNSRCFICSEKTNGKYEVGKYGAREVCDERSDICSGCRNRLVFGKGDPVFVSKSE